MRAGVKVVKEANRTLLKGTGPFWRLFLLSPPLGLPTVLLDSCLFTFKLLLVSALRYAFSPFASRLNPNLHPQPWHL